jgi:hypothetical protein
MTQSGPDDGRWMTAEVVEDASKADGGRVRGKLRRRRAVELKSRQSTLCESTVVPQVAVVDAMRDCEVALSSPVAIDAGRDGIESSGYDRGNVARRGAVCTEEPSQYTQPVDEAEAEAWSAPNDEWTTSMEWYPEQNTYNDSSMNTALSETIACSNAFDSTTGFESRVGSDCETGSGNAQDDCNVARRGAVCMKDVNALSRYRQAVDEAEVEAWRAPNDEWTDSTESYPEENMYKDSLTKLALAETTACSNSSGSTTGLESGAGSDCETSSGNAYEDCETSSGNAQDDCEYVDDSCRLRVKKMAEEEEDQEQKLNSQLFSELQVAILSYNLRRVGGASLFKSRVRSSEDLAGHVEGEQASASQKDRPSLMRAEDDLGHLVEHKDFVGADIAMACKQLDSMR